MSTTTVLLVDDHDVLAESLTMLLDSQADLDVIGTADTLARALELVGLLRPDVVLLDVTLPDGDGIAHIPTLLAAHPGTRIVVLTGTTGDRTLLSAVEAGATGFVSKSGGVRRLVDAVRAAAAGEAVLPQDLLDRLLPMMRRQQEQPAARLTEREIEVLQLVARGMTNAAIADELVLSLHTVRNHVASLSRKLGAHSKLEALSLALRSGLISPP